MLAAFARVIRSLLFTLILASGPASGMIFDHDDRVTRSAVSGSPYAPIGLVWADKLATGFLVDNCHVLTVQHVFSGEQSAIGRQALFGALILDQGHWTASLGKVVAAGGLKTIPLIMMPRACRTGHCCACRRASVQGSDMFGWSNRIEKRCRSCSQRAIQSIERMRTELQLTLLAASSALGRACGSTIARPCPETQAARFSARARTKIASGFRSTRFSPRRTNFPITACRSIPAMPTLPRRSESSFPTSPTF